MPDLSTPPMLAVNATISTLPTYYQITQFLANDPTHLNSANATYNCIDFANDVQRDAKAKGYECAVDIIDLAFGQGISVTSHAIVSFNTADRGVVTFEPQNNQPLDNPVVGGLFPYSSLQLLITKVNMIW